MHAVNFRHFYHTNGFLLATVAFATLVDGHIAVGVARAARPRSRPKNGAVRTRRTFDQFLEAEYTNPKVPVSKTTGRNIAETRLLRGLGLEVDTAKLPPSWNITNDQHSIDFGLFAILTQTEFDELVNEETFRSWHCPFGKAPIPREVLVEFLKNLKSTLDKAKAMELEKEVAATIEATVPAVQSLKSTARAVSVTRSTSKRAVKKTAAKKIMKNKKKCVARPSKRAKR